MAITDTCTHLGAPLHDGEVTGTGAATTITCPWHGSEFRFRDGEVVDGPAATPQPTVETRVRRGRVLARVVGPPALRPTTRPTDEERREQRASTDVAGQALGQRRGRARPADRGADRRGRADHLDRDLRFRPAPVRGAGAVHGQGRRPGSRAHGRRRGGGVRGHEPERGRPGRHPVQHLLRALLHVRAAGCSAQCETTQVREKGSGAALFGFSSLYGSVPGGQAEYLRVPHADYGPIKVGRRATRARPTSGTCSSPTSSPPPGRACSTPTSPRAAPSPCWAWARSASSRPASAATSATRSSPWTRSRNAAQMAQRHGVEAHRPHRRTVPTSSRSCASAPTAAGPTPSSTPSAWRRTAAPRAPWRRPRRPPSGCCRTSWRRRSWRRPASTACGRCGRPSTRSVAGAPCRSRGVYGGEADPMPMMTMFDKQLQFRMGQCNVRRWIDDLLPLVEDPADPLGVMDLTTHRVPLEDAPEAYEMFQEKRDGCIKVVLEPVNPAAPPAPRSALRTALAAPPPGSWRARCVPRSPRSDGALRSPRERRQALRSWATRRGSVQSRSLVRTGCAVELRTRAPRSARTRSAKSRSSWAGTAPGNRRRRGTSRRARRGSPRARGGPCTVRTPGRPLRTARASPVWTVAGPASRTVPSSRSIPVVARAHGGAAATPRDAESPSVQAIQVERQVRRGHGARAPRRRPRARAAPTLPAREVTTRAPRRRRPGRRWRRGRASATTTRSTGTGQPTAAARTDATHRSMVAASSRAGTTTTTRRRFTGSGHRRAPPT